MMSWKQLSLPLRLLAALAALLSLETSSVFAFHFPWDQGHDTFRPDGGDDDTDPGPDGPCQSGSPVEFASGNLVHEEVDLKVTSLGPVLSLVRTYNSRDMRSGPFGHGWSFSYDQRLVETTDGVSTFSVCHQGDGKRERYLRQANGSYLPPPFLSSNLVKNSNGTFTIYDRQGERRDFDSSGRLIAVTDRSGNSLRLQYDVTGFLVSMTNAVGRSLQFTKGPNGKVASVINPAGRVFRYSYSSAGDLVATIDPLGNRTEYTYDIKHNLLKVVDPRGNTIRQATYDSRGRIATLTDRGEAWTYIYTPEQRKTERRDALNNRWTFFYNDTGSVVRVVDPLGGQESYAYTPTSRLASFTNKNGRTTSFEYTDRGNPGVVIDALGKRTQVAYDVAGRVASVTDPSGRVTRFEYDSRGNLARTLNALNKSVHFEYNSLGQLTKIADPLVGDYSLEYDEGGHLSIQRSPLGDITSVDHDALGNRVLLTDTKGRSTRFEYDEENRLIRVANAGGDVTSYTYDASDNLVEVRDPNGRPTFLEYDPFNRLTRIVNSLGQAKRFAYDLKGRLVQVTDPSGRVTTYSYDALNRLTRKQTPDNTTTYTYDAAGNVLSMQDAYAGLTFRYDELNRPVEVATLATPYQPATVIRYAYDTNGNRLRMTAPDGEVTNYSYDARNRLVGIAGSLGSVSYSYDASSRRTGRVLPNGTSTRLSYDAARRLVGIEQLNASGIFSATAYTYDGLGSRLSSTGPAGAIAYVYDELNRLIGATGGSITEAYSYDAGGNRIASHLSAGYMYDVASRLTENDRFIFAYDPNGNLVRRTEKSSGSATTYNYDTDNRLIKIDFPDGGTAEYRYDPRGRRIQKNVNGQITRYIYDGEDILLELDGSNNIVARYTHGQGLDEPLIVRRAEGNFFYHVDALGSITSITDQSGVEVKSFTYDSFGRSEDHQGIDFRYSFTGREYDRESGLYHYRLRSYDPEIGRFLQEDPLRFAGGGTDLYSYVLNSPLNLTDPFGLRPCGPNWLDWLQTGLDLGGLIPGLGEPLDLLNAGIYSLRGDGLNAGLSAAGAIPFVGWGATGGKLGGKLLKNNVDGGAATVDQALRNAENWLGEGYREISEGVYRSADDARQFRMTDNDLTDPVQGPHVHFEAIGPNGRTIIENSHVRLIDP
jgi:RHS repeat-associated protein